MLNIRIKELRNSFNMSQTKLGELLNLSQQAVAKWEKGTAEPDSENIIKLSGIFKVAVNYLLGNTDIKIPNTTSIQFKNVQEAISFILEQPMLQALGGYNFDKMTKSEIIAFANELLSHLELLGHKYKK